MSLRYPPVPVSPLLFLDYDGTLAPIVDDPMQAFPHPEVPDLLRELDKKYPLWIVTGRNLNDLSVLLGVPLQGIGLHGAQEGRIGGPTEYLVNEDAIRGLNEMKATVPLQPGVWVEDKGITFAVHYRTAADPDAVRNALETWASGIPDELEAIRGKMVIELKPGGIDKGKAVRRIADRYPGRTPVYIGDDATDEDAFRALDGDAVTIKVGKTLGAARYLLSGVDEVVEYLKRFV